ncbi:unnamed protein product, partial [marine sediment metagenome]
MKVRDLVENYISYGWYPIPLKSRSKECRDSDWMQRVYDEDDFSANDNVGLRLVRDDDPNRKIKLIDIDCDSDEVVSTADKFLPSCNVIYGRSKKPNSHYLYQSLFKKTVAYQDLTPDAEQKTLIEIRVDHQSMAPPSVHPSGDILVWTRIGAAQEIDPTILQRRVRLCATCAMVARYYNPKGLRHNWGLALAGYFKGLGINEEDCILVMIEAAKIAGDTELSDRLSAVRSTYAKDEALQGAKALQDYM